VATLSVWGRVGGPYQPSPVAPALLAIGCLAASVAAGAQVGTADPQQPIGIVAGVLALGAVFAIRSTPVALAILALYLGVVDGYLKLATGSDYATFGRDVVLLGVVAGTLWRSVILDRSSRLSLPPLGLFVVAIVGVVAVQVLNPEANGVRASIVGLRQHIEWVPLFFLAYAAVRRTEHLRALLIVMLIVGAANGAVSLVQSQLTPQQLAGWGKGYAERIKGKGKFVGSARVTFEAGTGQTTTRPFGLGSEVGAGGVFAMLGLTAALGLLIAGSARSRLLVLLLAGPLIAGVVTSGARASFVATYAAILGFGALAVVSRQAVRGLIALAVVSAVAVGGVTVVSNGDDRSARAERRGSVSSPTRALSTYREERLTSLQLFPRYAKSYPLGAGLASVGPSAAALATDSSELLDSEPLDSENEFNFLIVELGIPGLIAFLAFTVVVTVLGVLRIRALPEYRDRIFLAAILAPMFGVIALYFAGPFTATVPSGPYLWAAAGIVAGWLFGRRQPEVGTGSAAA